MSTLKVVLQGGKPELGRLMVMVSVLVRCVGSPWGGVVCVLNGQQHLRLGGENTKSCLNNQYYKDDCSIKDTTCCTANS